MRHPVSPSLSLKHHPAYLSDLPMCGLYLVSRGASNSTVSNPTSWFTSLPPPRFLHQQSSPFQLTAIPSVLLLRPKFVKLCLAPLFSAHPHPIQVQMQFTLFSKHVRNPTAVHTVPTFVWASILSCLCYCQQPPKGFLGFSLPPPPTPIINSQHSCQGNHLKT